MRLRSISAPSAELVYMPESLTPFLEKANTLELIVDYREKRLSEELSKLGAHVKLENLPVGDVIVSERVCVERKTRNDFENSIMDTRLFEQSKRLSSSFERPIIIVEGEKFEERIRRSALLGALSSLLLDYNIPVFFTKNIEKTAELIHALVKREQGENNRPARLVGNKKAHRVEDQQKMILETIPMIGPKYSEKLLVKFGTLENVICANEKELKEVVGEKRSKIIKNICRHVYCNES